ncbi:hypothetical protein HY251_03070 [bacterium]|nr:hypothetical protein [bacterium]
MRRGLLAAAAALALAAVLASVTRAPLAARPAAALLLELEALVVALAAPLVAARVLEGEERGESGALAREGGPALAAFAAAGLSLLVAGALRGVPGAGAGLLAQLLLLFFGVGVFSLSLAVGKRAGSGAALAAGLVLGAVLLGFPYLGGDLVAALPHAAEEAAVYWIVALCPAIALAGTFAETDPFRDGILYERFRPVGLGEVGCQYASPARALLVHAAIAAAFAVIAALARRKPGQRHPPGAVGVGGEEGSAPLSKGIALAVLLLLLLSPGTARAQNAPPAEGEIGPLGTRVRLGYLLPFTDGSFKVSAYHGAFANRFDFKRDVDLQPEFITPTFEAEVGWQGAGRVWVEYWEAHQKGEVIAPFESTLAYRNITIPRSDTARVSYQFRTVALHGSLDIPILDWVTLKITGTTRYAHFFTELRDRRIFLKDENNYDILIPGLGAGFDAFILDKIYVYGSLEWLDFSFFNHAPIHYREALLGVRLELLEYAHLGVEFYGLEIGVTSPRSEYHQRVLGPRIWVGIQF